MRVRVPGCEHPLIVRYETYRDSGRLAVVLESEDGSPFATLSCNLPEAEIGPDEFAVKVWSENEAIAGACRHLFADTGRTARAGYQTAPIWRLSHGTKVVVCDWGHPIAVYDGMEEALRLAMPDEMVRTYLRVPYRP